MKRDRIQRQFLQRGEVIRKVDEKSDSPSHSLVVKARRRTSACADTAGQGDE